MNAIPIAQHVLFVLSINSPWSEEKSTEQHALTVIKAKLSYN